MSAAIIQAHGGMNGPMEMLVGLGPVLLCGILLGFFGLLIGADMKRRKPSHGFRDETPTAGKLLFSGTYFEMEKLAQFNWDEDSAYDPAMKTGRKAAAV